MISQWPEVFGGMRCKRVANFLGKQTTRDWIFSICSDERIPLELEQRLNEAHLSERPTRLIIIGDFPSIPPECSPASSEAIRLVAKAAHFQGVIQVCWIDGEMIDFSNNSLPPLTWYEYSCNKQHRKAHIWPVLQPTLELERDICTKITKLLGRQPGIRLSDDGKVEALDLTDGETYRRSLAVGLSQKMEHWLWLLVKQLTYLRELRIGFSGLRAIPDLSVLKYLEILDLRGNPKIKLNQLSKITSLKKINAAACELENIPVGIENLLLLQTLLIHKNQINNVSTVKFPPLLERLSLYRNRISTGNLDLSRCKYINNINLGANPLSDMSVYIPDTLISLSLGLRNVSGRVQLVRSR